MNCTQKGILVFTLCAYLTPYLYAFDIFHFYRYTPLSSFVLETRLANPKLSSLDFFLSGGQTNTSFNRYGKKTALLNLYGPHQLNLLGLGITPKDPSNALDQLLQDVAALGGNERFGQVCIDGEFRIFEGAFSYAQNIRDGFFFQCYLPIRVMHLSNLAFKDLSPRGGAGPNAQLKLWQQFLQDLPAITHRYGLDIGSVRESGIGDLSVLLGLAWNITRLHDLDFIDITLRSGFLAPTSPEQDINQAFALPLGYNGHWAIPGILQVAWGMFDWLTFGTHAQFLWFFNKTARMRVKTAPEQNGFIKLGIDTVERKPGMIWQLGVYLKADHVAYDTVSGIVAYSFTEQRPTCIHSCTHPETDDFINDDQMLRSWYQHALHLLLECDFARAERKVHPRISFFYTIPLAGKRVFDTFLLGSCAGMDITWHYA